MCFTKTSVKTNQSCHIAVCIVHCAKQYIKGKLVKFGYKLWMLCSSDGYPNNFEIYCGKDESRIKFLETNCRKNVECFSKPKSSRVFFDNFFTNHTLFTILAGENVRAYSTKRDKKANHFPLISKKD